MTRGLVGEGFCLLLLAATGVALLIGAASLPEPMFDPLGPAGLPRWIGWILLALTALRVVILAASARTAGADQPSEDTQFARLAAVAVITLLYLVALTVGGIPFQYLTLAFLALLGAAMTDLSPKKLLIVAVIAIAISYGLTYVFTNVLTVVLPQ